MKTIRVCITLLLSSLLLGSISAVGRGPAQAVEPPPRDSTCTSRDGVETDQAAAVHVWRTEIVAAGRRTGYSSSYYCSYYYDKQTDRSLRVDSADHLHVAYGVYDLYYAYHDGAGWQVETVDSVGDVGTYAALALDSSDRPHISYYDDSSGDLKYAYHDGTDWQIETVDSAGDVGKYTSLALDGSNRPHISYYDATNADLKYAHHNGASWQIETVDSAGNVGRYTSLALDSSNRPHIGYRRYDGLETITLKYAWHNGTDWQINTVWVNYSYGWPEDISLALDGADRPHISYYHDSVSNYGQEHYLEYVWYDGADWHTETVDDYSGWGNSLAVNGAGLPRISYYSSDGLRYAYHDGSSWHIETLNSNNGAYTSLALDGAGLPHIVHGDRGTDLLQHTWDDGTGWHTEAVDHDVHTGTQNSLSLDSAGRPHMSFREDHPAGFDDYLKYSYYDGTTWLTETVDSGEQMGEYNALALSGAGQPRIAYYDEANQDLKYARRTGSGWQVEKVTDAQSGRGVSLALDDAGLPHITYFDDDLGGVAYAWQNDGIWQIEKVDSAGPWGEQTGLTLDSAGRPHVSYRSSNDIRYAWRDGGTWHVETVDGEEYWSRFPSLALDSSGRPHISYGNWNERKLQYAWHDGAEWHIEVVEEAGHPIHTSLALDGMDRPRIAYCYAGEYDECGSVMYAWHDGATWRTEEVDYPGSYPSLALNGAGYPHISYYDNCSGDLMYTSLPAPSVTKQATPSDGLRIGGTLTYTITISGPGQPALLRDPLPDNVNYITGSITNALSPTAVYSPDARAVVWQGTLPTYTVQVSFSVTPTIDGLDPLSLSPPIVNTAWLTDTEFSTADSATAIVNSRRIYIPLAVQRLP